MFLLDSTMEMYKSLY